MWAASSAEWMVSPTAEHLVGSRAVATAEQKEYWWVAHLAAKTGDWKAVMRVCCWAALKAEHSDGNSVGPLAEQRAENWVDLTGSSMVEHSAAWWAC